jgi:hypothetical protein
MRENHFAKSMSEKMPFSSDLQCISATNYKFTTESGTAFPIYSLPVYVLVLEPESIIAIYHAVNNVKTLHGVNADVSSEITRM